MTAADELRIFLSPILPGWRIQLGRWMDDGSASRYAVIRPVGGGPASLVREPQFSMMLVGRLDDAITIPQEAAEEIIEAMRVSSGGLVFMEPGEPVYFAAEDGRHIFELAISAITT